MLAVNHQMHSLLISSPVAFFDSSISGRFAPPRLEGLQTIISQEEVIKSLDLTQLIQQSQDTVSNSDIGANDDTNQMLTTTQAKMGTGDQIIEEEKKYRNGSNQSFPINNLQKFQIFT
jgi:hypothetical protein